MSVSIVDVMICWTPPASRRERSSTSGMVMHQALWPIKEYRDGLPPDTTPPDYHEYAEVRA